MNQRRTILVVVIVLALAAAVAIASMAAPTSGPELQAGGSFAVSSKGTRVQVPKQTAAWHPTGVGRLFHLATRNGRAFYRFDGPGDNCFGVGDAASVGVLGHAACADASAPLIDLSIVEITRARPDEVRLVRVEGVAADRVATVGVMGVNGEIGARIPVVGNLYSMPFPPVGATRGLAALDASGAVLWRHPG
jgi:hypothetical protein